MVGQVTPWSRVHRTKPKTFLMAYFSLFFELPATPLVNVTIRLCENVNSDPFVGFGRATLQCGTCSKHANPSSNCNQQSRRFFFFFNVFERAKLKTLKRTKWRRICLILNSMYLWGNWILREKGVTLMLRPNKMCKRKKERKKKNFPSSKERKITFYDLGRESNGLLMSSRLIVIYL